ncbi:MAG: gamma-glutamylcyclotransferase [Oscillatoriales cyanobacterium C42_A2020_001]|nr:gamma-glutamylcyclotransferase [Leptolyngbyaceae cyanobacterium C42_A2020_001]
MSSLIHLFVYGTLKPGEPNHWVCAEFVVDAYPAIAPGRLYHLPFGYPAMTLAGSDSVHGYVLTFADLAALSTLDEFEQHCPDTFRRVVPEAIYEENQYSRQPIHVFNPKRWQVEVAWGYVMTHQQVYALRGVYVPTGNWTAANEYYC